MPLIEALWSAQVFIEQSWPMNKAERNLKKLTGGQREDEHLLISR